MVELNGRVEGTLVGVETLAAVTRCNLQVHNTKAMLTAIMTKVEDDSVIYAVVSELDMPYFFIPSSLTISPIVLRYAHVMLLPTRGINF